METGKNSEWQRMAGFEFSVQPKTLGQALFIQAVVLPEIAAVIDRYAKDIIELGKEN